MTTNATFELLQTLKLIAVPVDCQDVLCQFPVIPHYASPDGKHCSTFTYGWLLVQTLTFLASQKNIHVLTNEHICARAELLIPYPLHCFFFIQESRSSSKITTCWYPARQPYNEWRIHTSSGTGPNSAWQLKPATKIHKTSPGGPTCCSPLCLWGVTLYSMHNI